MQKYKQFPELHKTVMIVGYGKRKTVMYALIELVILGQISSKGKC